MSDEFQFDEAELVELRGMFFEQATEVIDSLSELIIKVESDPADSESHQIDPSCCSHAQG